MNLLQVQDSLKNLSDQHLMTEMQSPSGQVPQFLVLSELKRRKDMRASTQQPPSRTVAEDLTQPQQPPQQAPGAMSMAPQPQAAGGPAVGIHSLPPSGMKEGGVVRMQEGGRPPSPTGRLPVINPQFSFPQSTSQTTPLDVAIQELDLYKRSGTNVGPGLIQQTAAQYGVPPQALMSRFGIQTPSDDTNKTMASPADTAYAQQEEGGPPPFSMDGTRSLPTEVVPYQSGQPGQAQAGALTGTGQPVNQTPASGGATRPNGGPLGQLSAAINPVVASSAAAPAAAQVLQPPNTTVDRSAFNQILERMRGSEVNQTKAREDARNMALLQAGLAIAGGTSPHFATNLAGAIPHIQNYQTRIADLRKEGRDELKNQFDLAKADLDAQYHAGMLTQHQYATQSRQLENQRDNATRLAAARIGAAASGQNAAAAREERIAAREDRNEATRNALDVRKQEIISRALMEDPEAKSLAATLASVRPESAMGRDARTRLDARRAQITSQYNAMLGISQNDPLNIR